MEGMQGDAKMGEGMFNHGHLSADAQCRSDRGASRPLLQPMRRRSQSHRPILRRLRGPAVKRPGFHCGLASCALFAVESEEGAANDSGDGDDAVTDGK